MMGLFGGEPAGPEGASISRRANGAWFVTIENGDGTSWTREFPTQASAHHHFRLATDPEYAAAVVAMFDTSDARSGAVQSSTASLPKGTT